MRSWHDRKKRARRITEKKRRALLMWPRGGNWYGRGYVAILRMPYPQPRTWLAACAADDYLVYANDVVAQSGYTGETGG